jgi:hypothetical protein
MPSKNSTKAIGERIVANEMTFAGWLVVNTNSGEENSPNFDLIGLKGDLRVTVQVKATRSKSGDEESFHFGRYRADAVYFNSKDGPKCDFVVAVNFSSPKVYNCLVMDTGRANNIADKHAKGWWNTPKKDGGQRKPFPVYVSIKDNPDHAARTNLNSWELLEARG